MTANNNRKVSNRITSRKYLLFKRMPESRRLQTDPSHHHAVHRKMNVQQDLVEGN